MTTEKFQRICNLVNRINQLRHRQTPEQLAEKAASIVGGDCMWGNGPKIPASMFLPALQAHENAMAVEQAVLENELERM